MDWAVDCCFCSDGDLFVTSAEETNRCALACSGERRDEADELVAADSTRADAGLFLSPLSCFFDDDDDAISLSEVTTGIIFDDRFEEFDCFTSVPFVDDGT